MFVYDMKYAMGAPWPPGDRNRRHHRLGAQSAGRRLVTGFQGFGSLLRGAMATGDGEMATGNLMVFVDDCWCY